MITTALDGTIAPTVGQAIGPALGLDPRVWLAFTAGAFTFFAPCAYPLLPGYVAYFLSNGDGESDRPVPRRLARAVGVALVVSGGFFLVYAVLVGVVLAIGTGPLRDISVLELFVGGLLIVLGAGMATGRFQPSTLHLQLPERRRSVLGYFLFGVVYAAAAAGCTAPVFIGIATFAIGSDVTTAVVVFGAYALGMSLLMIALTVLSALGREAILTKISGRTGLLTRVAGVVLVVAGIVQIYFFLFEFQGLKMLGLG